MKGIVWNLLLAILLAMPCLGQIQPINNALDFYGHPSDANDSSPFIFSDQGAWHGYSIPDSNREGWGFVGPKLLAEQNGIWLGDRTMKLTWMDENGNQVNPTESYSEHGKLIQTGSAEELAIQLELGFINPNTTLLQLEVKNETEGRKRFTSSWSGSFFEPLVNKKGDDGVFRFKTAGGTYLAFGSSDWKSVEIDSMAYLTVNQRQYIEPNSVQVLNAFQIVAFDSITLEKEISATLKLNNHGVLIDQRATEWREILYKISNQSASEKERIILQKSLKTLMCNWRSPAGELKHAGLFPSTAINWFHGFWAWDSWKHAVAITRFNPQLAKNQVRAMFDFQNEQGMIADCVFRDTTIEKHNWRNTKSPLAAWAVSEIYDHDPDKEFVLEMLPKLQKYHDWWYSHRDQNKNGLCEFGSTDGTAIAAAWESGMDNAVRFDSVKIGVAASGAWTFDQESVDLNAYLCAEKNFLAKLYRVVGNETKAKHQERQAEMLAQVVRKAFWDQDAGYYFDRNLDGDLIDVYGPECWTVLWAGIASQEQAEKVVAQIMNQSRFNTKVPCPTLDASHPKFNPKKGYWRGPVWLDQFYFALNGMRKYGFKAEADSLLSKLVNNAEGLAEPGFAIHENYHPETGEALNAPHFSWSAAHLILIIEDACKTD